jgi:hypothetical protein
MDDRRMKQERVSSIYYSITPNMESPSLTPHFCRAGPHFLRTAARASCTPGPCRAAASRTRKPPRQRCRPRANSGSSGGSGPRACPASGRSTSVSRTRCGATASLAPRRWPAARRRPPCEGPGRAIPPHGVGTTPPLDDAASQGVPDDHLGALADVFQITDARGTFSSWMSMSSFEELGPRASIPTSDILFVGRQNFHP